MRIIIAGLGPASSTIIYQSHLVHNLCSF